jgi:predicted component of viral defense system (DUF524 family)
MNQNALDSIRKSLKFKYDEHVSKLVSMPNAHLEKIVPNRAIPITDILKGFNGDSGKELLRFGNEIESEISRILDKLKLLSFTESDKDSILKIVDDYCKADLYLKRFAIMVSAIERKASSYGQKANIPQNNIELQRTLCEAFARNTTQRIKSKVANELEFFKESFQSKSTEKENVIDEVADCIELKPNLFGMGLNLNAIFSKFRKKKKT